MVSIKFLFVCLYCKLDSYLLESEKLSVVWLQPLLFIDHEQFNFSEFRAHPMAGIVLGACKVKMKKDMIMAIKEAKSKTMCWMWKERTFQVEGVTLEKG